MSKFSVLPVKMLTVFRMLVVIPIKLPDSAAFYKARTGNEQWKTLVENPLTNGEQAVVSDR
jgi:hypothetical protein